MSGSWARRPKEAIVPADDGVAAMPSRFSNVLLPRQLASFVVVGCAAAVAHYGTLIGLVEAAHWKPVPAALVGYVAGGVVSYLLNERLTFTSRRRHRDALWRFAAVAGVGFGLTALLMSLLVDRWALPYLPAQVFTTGCVVVWSFLAHKLWTFGEAAPALKG